MFYTAPYGRGSENPRLRAVPIGSGTPVPSPQPSPIAERTVLTITREMPAIVGIASLEKLAPAFVPQLTLLPGYPRGPGSRFIMLESRGWLINHFVTGLACAQAKIH